MKIRTKAEKWSFVVLVSALSISMSVLMHQLMQPDQLRAFAVLPSLLTPLIIAPPISLWAANMILRVHTLNRRLEHLLAHDYMTGLANRRAFIDFVEGHKGDGGGAVMILDIDRFKAVNDTYGHHIGDQMIQMVAKVLKHETDGIGKAARLGGEEFGVFLPHLPLDSGITRANQIREAVERQRLPLHDQTLQCTLSVGVDYLFAFEEIDVALQRADAALYQAKSDGRNRVVRYRRAPRS